jgi:ABC-type dipeptide/oligopeptide/nickel transport system permease component
MQRFILNRFVQAIATLFAVRIIVFGLARIADSPLDSLVSFESGPEQKAAVERYWGLDKPLPLQ